MAPNPELAKRIAGFAPVFASDDFIVQIRAAEAGLGAIFLPRMRHRFSRSELVEIDLEVPFRTATHLVCARTALDIPRIRAVADALLRELDHTREPKRSTKKQLRP
jgi:DNA-binding transcriptional LysR family regulator